MQRRTVYQILLAASMLLCAVTAVAVYRRVQAQKAGGESAASVLAIPAPARKSLADQDIARWSDQARQKPNDTSAWANLGDALMQKARETADVSYYNHAEKAYRKALALNARNADATAGMAWVYGGRHEFEKSIEWANKAIALDPKDSTPYGLLGDADVEMGNYDAAFVHYQKMQDVRPDISSYSRGAHLVYLAGDTRKAMWLMIKAISAGGPYRENTAWCYAQLAQMLFNTGAISPAEQVVEQGMKAKSSDYHLLLMQGKLKAARKDYVAAIDYYKQAVAIAPQIDAVAALGDLYRLIGKSDEAEKQYALVETIDKLYKANGVRGDRLIAQFYADHDRNLPQALQMEEAEYKTRKNVYVADTLAWCYYKNGRYAEAQKAIQEAMRQKTPEALFLFHAGMIAAKLGDRQTAQYDLYQALSTNAQFSPLYTPVAEQMICELGSQSPYVRQASAR